MRTASPLQQQSSPVQWEFPLHQIQILKVRVFSLSRKTMPISLPVLNSKSPKREVSSRLHFWYSHTVHYLSWKRCEIVKRVPMWMAIISSLGKTLTAWTGSHDVDVASQVRSHGGGTAAHGDRRPLRRLHHWRCFGLGYPSAFIYPFSRHLLRVKQQSPPTQTVEKSPQPSKERRQAFPPGTECRTFSSGLSAAEAGTRMRGICGTFQALYCLFKFLPMFPCLVSPRKRKHRISFYFVSPALGMDLRQ